MPSFSEIGKVVNLHSKNAVFKLVNKLEQLKFLERDEKGRLIPKSIGFSVKVLGTVHGQGQFSIWMLMPSLHPANRQPSYKLICQFNFNR
jgi:SOS-response transcriptional repressor LexA